MQPLDSFISAYVLSLKVCTCVASPHHQLSLFYYLFSKIWFWLYHPVELTNEILSQCLPSAPVLIRLLGNALVWTALSLPLMSAWNKSVLGQERSALHVAAFALSEVSLSRSVLDSRSRFAFRPEHNLTDSEAAAVAHLYRAPLVLPQDSAGSCFALFWCFVLAFLQFIVALLLLGGHFLYLIVVILLYFFYLFLYQEKLRWKGSRNHIIFKSYNFKVKADLCSAFAFKFAPAKGHFNF